MFKIKIASIIAGFFTGLIVLMGFFSSEFPKGHAFEVIVFWFLYPSLSVAISIYKMSSKVYFNPDRKNKSIAKNIGFSLLAMPLTLLIWLAFCLVLGWGKALLIAYYVLIGTPMIFCILFAHILVGIFGYLSLENIEIDEALKNTEKEFIDIDKNIENYKAEQEAKKSNRFW